DRFIFVKKRRGHESILLLKCAMLAQIPSESGKIKQRGIDMKAILVEEFGTAAVLKMTERPVPQLNDNQLLIEQFATSINPSDWKKRGGEWGGKLPFIPGNDAAGIIRK